MKISQKKIQNNNCKGSFNFLKTQLLRFRVQINLKFKMLPKKNLKHFFVNNKEQKKFKR
jgi:hypothetical protein